MRHLIENAVTFQRITKRVLFEMFGINEMELSEVELTTSVETKKSFIVSIYYTGTVYGEYLIALDLETAARIAGVDTPLDEENHDWIETQVADAFSEILNMVVGESLVQLQSTYAKLTLTPPRVYFGKVRYPQFRTGRGTIQTPLGEVECHFCLDLMRLDLATSYNDALSSLIAVNNKLKEANAHLAEQQSQLVHSEKMASIGMLASGVAHEINNPLFFVEANLTTLNDYVTIIDSMIDLYERLCESVHTSDREMLNALAKVEAESEGNDIDFVLEDTQKLVAETREGIRRIKSIVRGLKEFSQVDLGGITETDLNALLKNAIGLLSYELTDRIRVDLDCNSIPRVQCHAGEVGQVLFNVLLNAAQSIPEHGEIRVHTKATESDVVIVIEDSGRGIPTGDLDRIFDPFFTTKPEGKGVGLGLSISYGIIRKHHGSISVESEINKGSRFTIRLPIVSGALLCSCSVDLHES